MTDEAREAAEWIVANVPNHTRGHFVARAYLRELAEEGGWQPIETAPRTSHAILVWCPERKNTYVVSWFTDPYLVSCWMHFGAGVRACLSETPTHWRPLPTPPTKDQP